MVLIAIVDVSDNKDTGRVYKFFVTDNLQTGKIGVGNEAVVLQTVQAYRAKPINFNIKSGKITAEFGSFERLKDKSGVSPRVLLAEYVTKSGRIIGYIILSKNGTISRVRREDLLAYSRKSKEVGVAFVQNAIYREVDGTPQIVAYAGCEFPRIEQQLKKKLDEAKSQVNTASTTQPKSDMKSSVVSTGNIKPAQTNKTIKPTSTIEDLKKPAIVRPKKSNEKGYSEAQKKEMIASKKNGVDPTIISSPKLSPEQMRIIWTSKKNGISSEYFANPKFSVEQMRFFADRLTDRDVFLECKAIINPKYNIDQLGELYLGIIDGVDYTVYADENLSAEDMYIKRNQLMATTFSSLLLSDNNNLSNGRHFLAKIGKGKSHNHNTDTDNNGDKKDN